MDSWQVAAILGVVEGLTEFLPVSSTGHLIIAAHLLGFVGERAASFNIAIQLGAILAVVFLYRGRFAKLVPRRPRFSLKPRSAMDGLAGLWRITLATVPALTVGYLGLDDIKERLFNPEAVTIALAAGGMAILMVERYFARRVTNDIDRLSLPQALGIGLFQILALWPGTSRAAATIIGGMVVGLDRKSAAEFSFLIAVPVLCAASGYELIQIGNQLGAQERLDLGIGFFFSFVVALIAVKAFVSFLQRGRLTPFAWYRIGVAPIFYYLTRSLTL